MNFFSGILDEKSLNALVENKIPEHQRLDYKSHTLFNGERKDILNEITKDIVSFANAEGGCIIIGIEEESTIPIEVSGMNMSVEEFFGEWQDSINQRLSTSVEPMMQGVKWDYIPLKNGRLVIVITIPRSMRRPHGVLKGTTTYNFPIRKTSIGGHMNLEDVRRQVLNTEYFAAMAREFRKDRLKAMEEGEVPAKIDTDTRLCLHIIPVQSFEPGFIIDVSDDDKLNKLWMPTGGINSRNSDGFWKHYPVHGTKHGVSQGPLNYTGEYIQLFRNGIVEYYNAHLFYNPLYQEIPSWHMFEELLFNVVRENAKALEGFSVPRPWLIQVTIQGAKGYHCKFAFNSPYTGQLDRNTIHSQEGIWNERSDITEVMKPVLDSLANCFGAPRSVFIQDLEQKSGK